MKLVLQKLESLSSEIIVMLALFVLLHYQSESDRHPDRSNTSACTAWYATVLVK